MCFMCFETSSANIPDHLTHLSSPLLYRTESENNVTLTFGSVENIASPDESFKKDKKKKSDDAGLPAPAAAPTSPFKSP